MYLYVYCTLAAAKKGYTLLQRRSVGRQSHTNPHKPTAMMINVRRMQRNIYHLYRTTKINNHGPEKNITGGHTQSAYNLIFERRFSEWSGHWSTLGVML